MFMPGEGEELAGAGAAANLCSGLVPGREKGSWGNRCLKETLAQSGGPEAGRPAFDLLFRAVPVSFADDAVADSAFTRVTKTQANCQGSTGEYR